MTKYIVKLDSEHLAGDSLETIGIIELENADINSEIQLDGRSYTIVKSTISDHLDDQHNHPRILTVRPAQ